MKNFKGATDLLSIPNYTPGRLLDKLLEMNGSKTDRSIAPFLDVDPTGVSRIRQKHRAFSAAMILSIHETTGLTFQEIRELIGVPDAVF